MELFLSSVNNRVDEIDFSVVGEAGEWLWFKLSVRSMFSHDEDADGDDEREPMESDAEIVPISVARCCAVRLPIRLLEEHRRYLLRTGDVTTAAIVLLYPVAVSETRRASSSNVQGSPISM